MLILKKEIIKSIKNTDIATGESEFSISLLKEESSKNNLNCYYDVLPNGYDISSIKKIVNKKEVLSKYAITIGTYKYKQIKVALKLFHQIKYANNLRKFIIVGPINNIQISNGMSL